MARLHPVPPDNRSRIDLRGDPAPRTVLVLDANQRSALAVIRSLGRRGLRVVAADEMTPTLGGYSRYCAGSFVYPSPYADPTRFVDALSTETAQRGCGVVFPTTDVTTLLLARFRERLPSVRVPLASLETIETLNDKWRLYRLARDLDLPVPETRLADANELRRGATGDIAYPFVLKPVRSRTLTGEGWLQGSVHYIASASDLPAAFAADPCLGQIPYLAQECIGGSGQGIFALFDRGAPVTFFAHRRIREKPPAGGVSVLSESVPLDSRLVSIARRLLAAVAWHGIAMVEFKITSHGEPYLLEVNPRFWGSLQLAVDAGVDFPWLLYQLAAGGPLDPGRAYAIGVRNRWLLGDLDNLYLTLRQGGRPTAKLRAIRSFLARGGPDTRYEINRWDDLRPFGLELRRYVAELFA